jgi:hypothetical protein
MSHAPGRKEKDCLNCGELVLGRFCQHCGQENIVPHENFLSMLHHFFADITHFDGKFFSSLAILIRKPGFLSTAYISGKRNSYLNPVRMYVFTSALFFLVFFSTFNTRDFKVEGKKTEGEAKDLKISTKFQPYDERYTSLAEYDSIQNALPPSRKDGWFRRIANHKSLEIGEHDKKDSGEFWIEVLEKFMHSLPYMLFVSLPLYALFLKILYFRRKQFYYADHGIFLIHLYIFTFIILLLLLGINAIRSMAGIGWMGFLMAALMVFGLLYALRAMKFFYKQGWGKTIVKFLLFNILCVLALSLLFTLFFGLSIFRL